MEWKKETQRKKNTTATHRRIHIQAAIVNKCVLEYARSVYEEEKGTTRRRRRKKELNRNAKTTTQAYGSET